MLLGDDVPVAESKGAHQLFELIQLILVVAMMLLIGLIQILLDAQIIVGKMHHKQVVTHCDVFKQLNEFGSANLFELEARHVQVAQHLGLF